MIDLPHSLTEHEEIENFAYRLYEDEGKPEGRADEHWARAEQFIHAERLAIASSSEKTPTDFHDFHAVARKRGD